MNDVGILLLIVPVFLPSLLTLDVNLVWFGIIMTKTAEIGLVTPPLGMNVFVACGAAGSRIENGFRGVAPFILGEIVVIGLLFLVPELSTWLPSLMD